MTKGVIDLRHLYLSYPNVECITLGVEVNGEYLHPAQAYEFWLDLLLFGYLWLRLKKVSYTGQIFLHYLIGFMVIRGIVEFFRINPMVFGPFSVSHVMSLIGIIVGILLINYRKHIGAIDHAVEPIKQRDIVRIALAVVGLIIISTFVYYLLHG